MQVNLNLKKYSTTFSLQIQDEISQEDKKSIFFEIEKIIDNYEFLFSRFKKESDISKLNEKKEKEVSWIFLKLIRLSKEIYTFTNGYFNPFLNLWNLGYGEKNWDFLFSKNFDENITIQWNKISLLWEACLDLWWIAKWYVVDIICSHLKKYKLKNFFVNFGWDIYLAWKYTKKENWTIGIQNPFRSIGENFWIIEVKDASISTSWSYRRNWEYDNKKYHHIFNPLTGKNENELISVSIVWKKTFFTDAIATSIFNMGEIDGLNFLNKNFIDWIIISKNGNISFSKGFKEKYNYKVC